MTVLSVNDNHDYLLWSGYEYVMMTEWQLMLLDKYGGWQ